MQVKCQYQRVPLRTCFVAQSRVDACEHGAALLPNFTLVCLWAKALFKLHHGSRMDMELQGRGSPVSLIACQT